MPAAIAGLFTGLGVHQAHVSSAEREAERIQKKINILQETLEQGSQLIDNLQQQGIINKKHNKIVICNPLNTTLNSMTIKDDTKAMEQILRYAPKTFSINGLDKNGQAALHIAVQLDRENSIKFLIRYRADINLRDEKGKSPLLYATLGHKTDTMQLLLKEKADPYITDLKGMTPLHHAANMCAPDLIKVLLTDCPKETIINLTDKMGKTPLLHAIDRGHLATIRLLLELGADPNIQDILGMTAVHYAAQKGNLNLLQELLKCNANINAKNKKDQTPLMLALLSKKEPVVRYILSLKIVHNQSKNPEIEYTAHHVSALHMCMDMKDKSTREKTTDTLLSALTDRSLGDTSNNASSSKSAQCSSISGECGICFEEFDENRWPSIFSCCSKMVCLTCEKQITAKKMDCPWCKRKNKLYTLLHTQKKSSEKMLAIK